MSSGPEELDIRLANKDIQELVKEIERKKIVLPDFQRDFVWPTHQIGKLLESLLNGYYINTLLTLPVTRGDDNSVPFPPRKIDGVPDHDDFPFNMEMVLDGQQRVTSVYYALTAPYGHSDPDKNYSLSNTKYPQLFCLDLESVIEGEFDDDAVIWRRRDWSTSEQLIQNEYDVQLEKGLIPFTVFKSKTTFKNWRRGLESYILDTETELTRRDIDAIEDNTDVFRDYEIPIVQMGVGTSPSKVVQTFERINTQGLELGIFDILTARLYPKEINLRELWESGVTDYSDLNDYASNIGTKRARERTLRTLALYRGEECKEESLGELSADNFEEDWESTLQIMERGLEKAKSTDIGGFGVTDKYGFPYGSILPPLANLLHVAENRGTYPTRESLEKVRRWYWASIFSGRYSGSSDSISYKDYNEVKAWIEDEDASEPEAIADASNIIPVELELTTLTRGGPYRGIMSLLVLNGARDFASGEAITVHEVDNHHIFPNAKLKSGCLGTKYAETERNQILNRTIIQSRANRFKYQDRLPSDYIREMIEENGGDQCEVKDLLRDHFINEDGFEALLEDDFEGFCSARKETIREAIKKEVGVDIDWSVTESSI